MSDTEQLPFSELGLAAPVLKALCGTWAMGARPHPGLQQFPTWDGGTRSAGAGANRYRKTAAFALPLLSRLEAGNRNTC